MGKTGIGRLKNAARAIFSRDHKTEPEKSYKKTPAKGGGKKRRAVVTVSLAIVLVLVTAFALGRKAGTERLSLAFDETTVLAYTDFTNSIGATGTVESAESTLIYSTLSAVVQDIYVEVGDPVREGQLLARLDGQRIEDQIASQETSLKTAEAGSAQALKTARDNYNQFKDALEKGLNAGINGAQAQVDAAYDNYTKALETYARYREALNAGENTALLNQEAARLNAKLAQDMAKGACLRAQAEADQAREAWAAARDILADLEGQKQAGSGDQGLEIDDPDLETMIIAAAQAEVKTRESYETALSLLEQEQKKLGKAEKDYDLAKAQYNAAVTNADNMRADYAGAVESAERAYREALKNLEAARLAAENQLQSYGNALQSATINADHSVARVGLNQTRVELDSTNITTPAAGTVTAVYAAIGSPGSGLLFVIEDADHFMIETTIKEYDIVTVDVGMPVTIKSNATGNDLYEGTVLSIAPTSIKTPQGTTAPSGEVEFAAKVKVTSPETRLRIGMSVRLDYIVEQRANVLSVPFDAVYINQAGEECVLVLEERAAGKYLVKEAAVTPELENDFAVVISSAVLSAGRRIIKAPEEHRLLVDKEIVLIDRPAPEKTPFPWR